MTDNMKNKMQNRLLALYVVLILLLFVIIGIYRPIQTIRASEGTIEDTILGVGWVIRDEIVVNGPSEGWIIDSTEGGVRIRKNDVIVKFANVEPTIKREGNNNQDTLKDSVEDEINKRKLEIQRLNLAGDTYRAAATFNRLLDLLSNVNEYQDKGKANNTELKSFTITAPRAGIVSYHIDGLEDKLTIASLSNLSKEYLNNLEGRAIETGKEQFKEDSPILKIFDNLKWYLAIVLRGDTETHEFKKGQRIQVYLEDSSEKLAATVQSINEGDDSLTLVLLCDTQLKNIDSLRKTNVRIIDKTHSGIKIPEESIYQHQGKDGVILKQRGKYIFKEVSIIAKDKESVIVEGIRTMDEVVINPKWVKRLYWR
jgi:putative membrane fusion protein